MKIRLSVIKRVEDGEDHEKRPTFSDQVKYDVEYTIQAGKMQFILPIDGISNEDESCKLTGITLTLESELTKKPVYRDNVRINEED